MAGPLIATFSLIQFAFIAFMVITYWKVLEKANLPGWGMFIPFYNIYLHFKMAGRSGWQMFLLLIPIVNIFVIISVNMDIAKRFGQPASFGIGMTLLGFIFYPLIAFSDMTYQGDFQHEEQLVTEIGEDGEVVEKIEVRPDGQW